MKLSHHAAVRWAERCAGLDPAQELLTLRRPGKKLIRMLQGAWRRSQPLNPVCTDRYYMLSASGVLLVIGHDQVIVTVMRASDIKFWDRRRRRNHRHRD